MGKAGPTHGVEESKCESLLVRLTVHSVGFTKLQAHTT